MKIICDNCRTKYSIADEKVKGKVFKIRCKKCQNIIVVRGNEGDAAGAADDGAAEESFQAPEQAETKDSPVWHLVIGREQVGPMSGAEVRDRFGRGEIDVESYIWREGFADWQRLTAVPEFADLGQATAVVAPSRAEAPAPAAPAAQDWQGGGGGGAAWNAPADAGWAGSGASEDTARADAANLFGGSLGDPGRDLFASQHGQEAFSSAATERPAPVENNLFGAAPAPAGGDLFPAAGGGSNGGQQLFPSEDAAAGGGGGGGDVQMTGQRHENSVLFSLTNLQALAMGGGRPVSASPSASPSPSLGSGSGGDGSGLIDIRAMSVPAPAGASLGSGMDDLPDLGGFSAPIATAPVLMPMAVAEERPKWILPTVFGVGGTLIVAVVVLLVVLVTRKPEPVQVVQAPVPVPVAGGAAIPAKPEAKPETKPETKPEAKADEKGAAENKGDDVKVARKGGKGKKGKKGGGGTLLAKADPVAAEPAGKSTKGGGKKKGGDALDDLIDGAITGKKGGGGSTPKKAAAAAAPASNLPDALSRSDIQGGMRKIKDRVQGCYDKFRVPGTAFVTVTISQAGSVSAAKVKGMFAGTPTGACLQAAARSATFPRVKGPAITIDYPFILR